MKNNQKLLTKKRRILLELTLAMKKLLLFFIYLICFINAKAQVEYRHINIKDSLIKLEQLNTAKEKVEVLMHISINYAYFKGDSAMIFLKKAEALSIENNLSTKLPLIYFYMASCNSNTLSNYPAALTYAFESLKSLGNINKVDKELQDLTLYANYAVANTYAFLLNKVKSNEYMTKALEEYKKIEPKYSNGDKMTIYGVFTETYIRNNEIEDAKKYNNLALAINESYSFKDRWGIPYISKAILLQKENKQEEAIIYYKKSVPHSIIRNVLKDESQAYLGIAQSFYDLKKFDSSLVYCNKIIENAKVITFNEGLQKTYHIKYDIYKFNKAQDSCLKYLEKYNDIRDQIFNDSKSNDAQNMAMNEELNQRALVEQSAKQQKIYFLIVLFLVLFAIGCFFVVKQKQKNKIRKIEDERKSAELQAARDLQLSMLPKQNPKRADLDIATYIRSSTEVGGDYYDFFQQPDGTLFSVCGDATGHGVTSGMMVSVAKAGLNGIGPIKPNKILQKLNGVVKRVDLGTLRMSMNIAEIDTHEIHISSSAMPPIYLYKSATKTVEEYMNNGLPLGGLRDEEFVLETMPFETGDVLIQLSDGLPEAPNPLGDPYDYDQLRNLILVSCHLTAQEITDTLIKSVDQWMEGQHNPDDITIVITKKI